MKRLLRMAFNGATILSLLVCIATIVLWIRGYLVLDWWTYQYTNSVGRRYTSYSFSSNRGLLYLSMIDYRFKAAGKAEEYAKHYYAEGFSHRRVPTSANVLYTDSFWERLGFFAILDSNRPDIGGTYSFPGGHVPNWFVVLVSAILPACWFVGARRRRKKVGLCPQCGYDMRATPDRCPECGMAGAETVLAAGEGSSGGVG